MKKLKSILKKIVIVVVISLVAIIGFSLVFGKPAEEIIAENNKKIEELKEQKEYIEQVDTTLTEVSEEMYNLSMSISNDIQNNTLNKAEALLDYKKIGDKAIINTEKISDAQLKLSLITIEKNIGDYVKVSMDGITNMDSEKLVESSKYIENVTNEIDNYLVVKEKALEELDKQIKVIEKNSESVK